MCSTNVIPLIVTSLRCCPFHVGLHLARVSFDHLSFRSDSFNSRFQVGRSPNPKLCCALETVFSKRPKGSKRLNVTLSEAQSIESLHFCWRNKALSTLARASILGAAQGMYDESIFRIKLCVKQEIKGGGGGDPYLKGTWTAPTEVRYSADSWQVARL